MVVLGQVVRLSAFQFGARRTELRVRSPRDLPGVGSALVVYVGVVLLLTFICAGCVSKATAKAQAQAAFLAGQQQAFRQQQVAGMSVTIRGEVTNNIVPWTTGLTLAQALVAAGYFGPEPKDIIIVRAGRAIRVDPQQLLKGEDVPIQPGDLVQIESPPSTSIPQRGGTESP